jgi:hypothetical protein
MKSVVFFSQSGCLLPLLILWNLFFGWMFFKPLIWLAIEGILVLLFTLNSYILARRISSFTAKRSNVIDVEGEVVEEKRKLK